MHRGLVLTQVPPLTNGIPDMREFFTHWNYLHPAPYSQSGFAHLLLPFNYEGQAGVGGEEMARAFSFLLSNALDWAPDCYCARHAYFVFKRDPEGMQLAGRSLLKRPVCAEAKDWQVTHVVGGTLVRQGEDAFGARVVVFDRNGNKIFEREYKTAKPYFDLVGDCAIDILSFLGAKPNAELAAHLRKKRCEHFESIVDLGRAAFAEERSPAEFAIYDGILKRDPEFAEVRYWLSNQRHWADKNWDDEADQEALALNAYLMEAPLAAFHPSSCHNQELAGHYGAWIDAAAKLVGEDATAIVELRLGNLADGRNNKLTHTLLETAYEAVRRNPCLYVLHNRAENVCRTQGMGVNDAALAISISLTTIGIPALANPHTRVGAVLHTAYALGDLGHYGPAVTILDDVAIPAFDGEAAGVAASMAGKYTDILLNAGNFDKAAEMAYWAMEKRPDAWTRIRAWVCAGLAGRSDIAERLRRMHSALPDAMKRADGGSRCYALLDQICSGTPQSPAMNAIQYPGIGMNDAGVVAIIAHAENDLVCGTTQYRQTLRELYRRVPNSRVLWILLDAYDRRQPTEDMPAVYESLAWLHNDDLWVRQAVQAAEARHLHSVIPVEQAEKTLGEIRLYPWPIVPADVRDVPVTADYLNRAPPEVITFAVRRMVDKKEFAAASQLCLRALAVATALQQPALQDHYNYLYHLCSR